MLRILLVGMLLCVVTSSLHAQKIKISPIPQWVETPNLDLNKKRETQIGEGFRYLLFEKQINIQERESFHRYSVQVLSVDGIQEYSDVQIEYDPSFQKLEVHEVSIYRDGKKINKLNSDDFKLIQKESSADRYIYDGALNALIHLSDVQKNDIIDYSYSLKGFNPVYGKQYSGFLYHQFYAKVEKFHYRVLLSQGQPLGIHTNGNLFKPSKLTQSGLDIYQWDHDGLQAMSFDNNVPYWSAMYPMTSISTFSDWKSVVDWALPLYKYSEEGLDVIKKQLPEKNQNNARITDIIRYVQDDIRYLGLESGMSAYLPNSPQKVFKQKYGDCKDKSLLLVALLRSEGLEAYPVLVNTEWKNNIDAFTANANAFDHCVVTYKWKDKDYYVDPTISDQGGNLTGIYFPDYSRGLVLKAGNSELISFSEPIKSSQKVEELIIVKDLEGSASMKIKTEYRGKKADEIRSSFANSTIDEISKNYLNFYSGVYPDIEASAAIEYSDSDRNISNIVTTVENYDIKNFWQKADDDSQLIGEVYPLDLQTKLNFPQTASREMDYFLGNPEVFLLTTKIVMPEYWPVQSYHNKIDGGAFTYENEIKGEGNVIDISHKYELIKASIPGSEVSNLLDKKNLALDNLNFYLTYNPAGAGSSLSFLSVFICVLVLAISFYFGKKLYEGFNPAPQDISFYKGIGGWLVLPAISLIAVPVTIIFSLIDGEYFNSAVWTNIGVYGAGFKVYYGVTFVFLIFLFCFAILTAIFFFKLRTGAPQLFILLISINFVSLILEAYVGDQYFPELELDSSAKDIIRSVLGLFIWIPYFIKSERVKSTFTRTYISNKVDLVIADRITEEDASQKNYSE